MTPVQKPPATMRVASATPVPPLLPAHIFKNQLRRLRHAPATTLSEASPGGLLSQIWSFLLMQASRLQDCLHGCFPRRDSEVFACYEAQVSSGIKMSPSAKGAAHAQERG